MSRLFAKLAAGHESFSAMHNKEADAAVFVPHIEAGNAIKEIDEIIAIDGLHAESWRIQALTQGMQLVHAIDGLLDLSLQEPPQSRACADMGNGRS